MLVVIRVARCVQYQSTVSIVVIRVARCVQYQSTVSRLVCLGQAYTTSTPNIEADQTHDDMQSAVELLTRRWWLRGSSRARAGCSSPAAVWLEVLESDAICIPSGPCLVMLLHIRLQLLEYLLQSLHPIHVPAVRVPELHHDLHSVHQHDTISLAPRLLNTGKPSQV